MLPSLREALISHRVDLNYILVGLFLLGRDSAPDAFHRSITLKPRNMFHCFLPSHPRLGPGKGPWSRSASGKNCDGG